MFQICRQTKIFEIPSEGLTLPQMIATCDEPDIVKYCVKPKTSQSDCSCGQVYMSPLGESEFQIFINAIATADAEESKEVKKSDDIDFGAVKQCLDYFGSDSKVMKKFRRLADIAYDRTECPITIATYYGLFGAAPSHRVFAPDTLESLAKSQVCRDERALLVNFLVDHGHENFVMEGDYCDRKEVAQKLGATLALMDILSDETCVIAGGAACHLAHPDIPLQEYSDVDIFVFDRAEPIAKLDTIAKLIQILQDDGYTLCSMGPSIIAALGPINKRQIQIILTRAQTTHELIKRFDLDYIKIAYNGARILTTAGAERDCLTKICHGSFILVTPMRLMKAKLKGMTLDADGEELLSRNADQQHLIDSIKYSRVFIREEKGLDDAKYQRHQLQRIGLSVITDIASIANMKALGFSYEIQHTTTEVEEFLRSVVFRKEIFYPIGLPPGAQHSTLHSVCSSSILIELPPCIAIYTMIVSPESGAKNTLTIMNPDDCITYTKIHNDLIEKFASFTSTTYHPDPQIVNKIRVSITKATKNKWYKNGIPASAPDFIMTDTILHITATPASVSTSITSDGRVFTVTFEASKIVYKTPTLKTLSVFDKAYTNLI